MQVLQQTMIINDGDHLFFEDTTSDEYIDNPICDGCGTEMKTISIIKNSKGDVGLSTGLCEKCGYIKRIRNLSIDAYNLHFSDKWLVRRDEDVVENKYVYNKLKPYITGSSSVLDVGCGLGGNLLPFYKSGCDVYGVEPSKHRSAKAKVIMKNIETGTAENYLSGSDKYFEVIFIYNVLQFLENPFSVLEMAVNHLSDNGVIYIRVGAFGEKSNYSQFSHLGVIKNNLSLYALNDFLKKLNVFPVYYNKEPLELILSRKEGENTNQIISSAVRIDKKLIEKYVKKTLKLNKLRIFGKVNLFYNGRKTELSVKRPIGDILPVIFEHKSNKLPLLLK